MKRWRSLWCLILVLQMVAAPLLAAQDSTEYLAGRQFKVLQVERKDIGRLLKEQGLAVGAAEEIAAAVEPDAAVLETTTAMTLQQLLDAEGDVEVLDLPEGLTGPSNLLSRDGRAVNEITVALLPAGSRLLAARLRGSAASPPEPSLLLAARFQRGPTPKKYKPILIPLVPAITAAMWALLRKVFTPLTQRSKRSAAVVVGVGGGLLLGDSLFPTPSPPASPAPPVSPPTSPPPPQ